MTVSLSDICEAAKRIEKFAYHTPTYYIQGLSRRIRCEVNLKLECYQPIGAFKIRGAANKLCKLSNEDRKKGVLTLSSGNHGLAVAYTAKKMQTTTTIVAPINASSAKVKAIRECGGKIVKHGTTYLERYRKALEIQKETGAILVHPFDDADVIAGQGTIGLEILQDIPDVETVLVPVGGGGLISGISTAIKNIRKDVNVLGVSPTAKPGVYKSWKNGRIVNVKDEATIADGLATNMPGKLNLEIMMKYVDGFIFVTDNDIRKALVTLLEQNHILTEPSGAATTAALLYKYKKRRQSEKMVAVVSGGNISLQLLSKLIRAL
jgi:threonine dehydratase